MFFQGIRCGKCAHDRAQLTRETGGWVALVITLMLEPVQRVIRLSGSGTMSHGADPRPARIGHGGIRLVCKGKLFFKKKPATATHALHRPWGGLPHTRKWVHNKKSFPTRGWAPGCGRGVSPPPCYSLSSLSFRNSFKDASVSSYEVPVVFTSA